MSTHLLKKSHLRITLPSLYVAIPSFASRLGIRTFMFAAESPFSICIDSHYELASTLLCHALCLSNHSASLVTSLGAYEISAAVSSSELKLHDETINSAAELLCQSSGVLTHLVDVVLPRWEASVGDGVKGRPIELSRNVLTALSK